MPSNLVKTKRDERLWDKAKQRAKEEGHTEDWAYINGIYQNMKGKKADTSAGDGRFFVVPYRFAAVRVGPPSPSAPPRDEFPFQGCINFQGLVIDVENLAGTYREGKGWRTYMHYPYGEFRGSLGSDGDPLDVYVGPNALSPLATVIHQADPDTGKYDEDKVMVGFDDPNQAITAYKRQYDKPGFYRDGWHRVLPVTALAVWMYNPEARGKPVQARRRARR